MKFELDLYFILLPIATYGPLVPASTMGFDLFLCTITVNKFVYCTQTFISLSTSLALGWWYCSILLTENQNKEKMRDFYRFMKETRTLLGQEFGFMKATAVGFLEWRLYKWREELMEKIGGMERGIQYWRKWETGWGTGKKKKQQKQCRKRVKVDEK